MNRGALGAGFIPAAAALDGDPSVGAVARFDALAALDAELEVPVGASLATTSDSAVGVGDGSLAPRQPESPAWLTTSATMPMASARALARASLDLMNDFPFD